MDLLYLTTTGARSGAERTTPLASPQVSELLAVARAILTGVLTGQIELLEDPRTS